jgi:proteic killer suppression protein
MPLNSFASGVVENQRPVRHHEASSSASHSAACTLSSTQLFWAILELAFATQKLRRLCENEAAARAELGVQVAAKLKARLADLDVVDNLSQVAVGHLRPAKDATGLELLLDVTQDIRIRLRINHHTVPRRQDLSLDWSRVSRIKILGLEGNNG